MLCVTWTMHPNLIPTSELRFAFNVMFLYVSCRLMTNQIRFRLPRGFMLCFRGTLISAEEGIFHLTGNTPSSPHEDSLFFLAHKICGFFSRAFLRNKSQLGAENEKQSCQKNFFPCQHFQNFLKQDAKIVVVDLLGWWCGIMVTGCVHICIYI